MLINIVLVSIRNFFQKLSKNLTNLKHLNGSVYDTKSFANHTQPTIWTHNYITELYLSQFTFESLLYWSWHHFIKVISNLRLCIIPTSPWLRGFCPKKSVIIIYLPGCSGVLCPSPLVDLSASVHTLWTAPVFWFGQWNYCTALSTVEEIPINPHETLKGRQWEKTKIRP